MSEVSFTRKVEKGTDKKSPFTRAVEVPKRPRIFLWGDSGVGKTTLALQFPAPVVIDMEKGTELYGSNYSFDVIHTTSPDEVMESVKWLLDNKHNYKTLVIDPISVYWEALQKKWSDIFLKRNQQGSGFKFEFYEFQVKDWNTIKTEFKELLRLILALDMNVIVTARAKTKYADAGFMKAIGDTFDGEKSLPYAFHTMIRVYITADGRRMCQTLKDRSNKLPLINQEFNCKYEIFEKLLGKELLEKEVKINEKIEEETKKDKEVEEYIKQLHLSPKKLEERLQKYGVKEFKDLSPELKEVVLKKLKEAVEKTAK